MNIPARSTPSPQHHHRYSQPPNPISPSTSTNMMKRASLQPSIHTSMNTMHNSSGTTGETIRTKKRTPGRIRKLLGDFYLLAGRLPDAVNQ